MPSSSRVWKTFGSYALVGLLMSGFVLLGLAEFHEGIAEPFLRQLDQQIMQTIHAHASPGLTRLMFGLTWVGSVKIFVPFVALMSILLWWKCLRHDALLVVVAMGGAIVLNTALKLHFRQVRPDVPWALTHEHSFSFPSGHSVFAVALYGIVTYVVMGYLAATWQKVAEVVIALIMILGIGTSRIYLGVHYPSDVAAGYFVGSIWLATVISADWRLRHHKATL